MKDTENSKYVLSEERTLLAAERTFSAWLRTALAAMAGGLAVLRLVIFKTETHRIIAHTMGLTLILWGCLIIVLASIDFRNIRKKIDIAKNYKSSTLGYFVIVLPLVIVSILLIWVTLP